MTNFFVCCFHMFRVFAAKTRSSFAGTPRSQTRIFCQNVAFTFIMPALVIGTVITHSYFSSEIGSPTIGYGTSSCYLDSVTLVGLTMLLPIVLVVVCNTSFFAFTIYKIHSVRSLHATDSKSETNKSMQNFYIYLKLSSLTGAFWIVVVVNGFLEFEPLTVVSIVLNGLQGVFIFASYVCNKRVFDMYIRLLGSQGQSESGRSTQDSTVG